MQKADIYYLIRELISNFSTRTDEGIVSALNSYLISKEQSRQIFKDEVKNKRPEYSILRGCLYLQNNLLRKSSQFVYEVLEVIDELRYCLSDDTRKTINNLSAQVILRIFLSLYYEVVLLPLADKEDLKYIDQFIKVFPKEVIVMIIQKDRFSTRYIFEQQGIDLGSIQESESRLNDILDKFYNR